MVTGTLVKLAPFVREGASQCTDAEQCLPRAGGGEGSCGCVAAGSVLQN